MKNNWPQKSLDDLFILQMGKTPARENDKYWSGGKYKWVSIADIGKSQRYISDTKERITDLAVSESGIRQIPANTLIMSFKLSLGKVAITREPLYTNEAIMAFIDKGTTPMSLSFLFHLFRSKDWSAGTNKAVMGKTLNKATLKNVLIPVPSFTEQECISRHLDNVLRLISLREAALQKLNQIASSRFIELFGDPIKNPRKWNFKTLLELGHCKNGLNFHKGETGFRINCLGVGDFQNHSVIDRTDNLPFITVAEYPPKDYLLQDGDIVFVRSNGNKALVGRCLIVYPHDNPTI